MANKKSTKTSRKRSKWFQIIVGIVLLAFVILMMSDLLLKKPKPIILNNSVQQEVYKFTKQGELTFQSKEGDFISNLDLEFADNDYERGQGLMYRTELKESEGMLFIFPNEDMQSFFMKNTVISLDMLFINSNMEIVTIHKNTEPYSLESKASTSPAQYVLETIAGYTDKFNVEEGDKVIFRKTN